MQKNKTNKGKEYFLCFVSPPPPKSSSTVGVGSRRTGRDDDDDDDTPITARKTRNIWIYSTITFTFIFVN